MLALLARVQTLIAALPFGAESAHGWIDLVNRLIRPGLILGCSYLLALPLWDPERAQRWAMVVALYPESLWLALLVVVASVGLSKAVRDVKGPKR